MPLRTKTKSSEGSADCSGGFARSVSMQTLPPIGRSQSTPSSDSLGLIEIETQIETSSSVRSFALVPEAFSQPEATDGPKRFQRMCWSNVKGNIDTCHRPMIVKRINTLENRCDAYKRELKRVREREPLFTVDQIWKEQAEWKS